MISNIVRRLMESHRLDEMAISRGEAIASCIQLGTEFYEHFHKVYEEGTQSRNFLHHCGEMQGWYTSITKIVLKKNKKRLTDDQIKNWFLLAGSEPSVLFSNSAEAPKYEEFIKKFLSSSDRKVSDTLLYILE